jgi:hypothetical protein
MVPDVQLQLERQELATELAELLHSGRSNTAATYRWWKRATALARRLKRPRASVVADLTDDAEVMCWSLDADQQPALGSGRAHEGRDG